MSNVSASDFLRSAEKDYSSNKNQQFFYQKTAKKSRKFLKKGPFAAIITAMISFAAIIFAGGSLLGFQLHDLITTVTDVQHTTNSLRKPSILKNFLKNSSAENNFPKSLKAKFKKQGIEVGHIDNSGNFSTATPPKNTQYALKYKDQIVDGLKYDDITKSNLDFLNVNNKATGGRASSFYDNSANHHYRKQNFSRNDFADYKQTNTDVDNKNFKKTLNKRLGGDNGINLGINDKQTDSDGKPKNSVTNTDISEVSGPTASAKAKDYLDHISKKSQSANFSCMALKIGNMIANTASALETSQAVSFFMNIIENISKAKTGAGQNSAINSAMSFLQKSAETTIHDVKSGNDIKISGSPLESEGLKSIMQGVAPNKSAAANFSNNRSHHFLQNSPIMKSASTEACSASQAAGAAISLSTFWIPGSGLIKVSVGLFKKTLISVGISIAISTALSALIPTIAEVIFTNRLDNAVGKAGGELFANGAAAANSKLARSASGYAPSDKPTAQAFNHTINSVNQTDSTLARLNSNPFDLTNSNSFFSILLFNFKSIFTTSPSIIGSINNLKNTSNLALQKSISPNTFADGENTSFNTTYGDCPTLEAIGIAGDIYCNPKVTSDTSTLHLQPFSMTDIPKDPASKKYFDIIRPNLEVKNGKTIIKPNSRLAQKILYCDERESPLGVIDANIENARQHSLGIVGDNLPILNDIVDIANAAENIANKPWTTGQICANSSKNPVWDSEFKYYQRYIEDSRIFDQFGAFDSSEGQTNPVLGLKLNHEVKYPLDNSPSGTLARITGLTKFDAEGLLAIRDYNNYLASYHPEKVKFLAQPSIISHFSFFVNSKTSNTSTTSDQNHLKTNYSANSSAQNFQLISQIVNFSTKNPTRKTQEFTA